LQDEFERGTPDETWIPNVGKMIPRPTIVTGDARILKHPARVEALRAARTSFVILSDGFVNLGWRDQVIKVITVWDKLCATVGSLKQPSIIKIRMKPDVEIVMPFSQYQDRGALPEKRRAPRNEAS
jgi:hypothetical protein